MKFKVHLYALARVAVEVETDSTNPQEIVAAAEGMIDLNDAIRAGDAEYADDMAACLIDPLDDAGELIEVHPLAVKGEVVNGDYSFSPAGDVGNRLREVLSLLDKVKQLGAFDPSGKPWTDIEARLTSVNSLVKQATTLHAWASS